MIRLSASLSRKVPLPDIAFSSQQFGASMEIEVSDADRPEAIQARIRELYGLLSASIDEQLAQAQASANGQQPVDPPQPRSPRIPAAGNGNGQRSNRGGRAVMATAAQKKAIVAICKDRGLDIVEVLRDWNGDIERLTIKDASGVIDLLKGKTAVNGNHR